MNGPESRAMQRNREYYDDFSERYDKGRDRGYHALIDAIEFAAIEPYARDKEVLELGCGTGLILEKVAPIARRAQGIDISPGMLARARARGLDVKEGDLLDLPFEDESFDLVYSFKVLAHIDAIDRALAEAQRVTKIGGTLALEFYNRESLRYLVKKLAGPRPISSSKNEADISTRWDRLDELRSALPSGLTLEGWRGIRIVTPAAFTHELPLLGRLLGRLEVYLSTGSLARFGGFLVLILRREA